MKVILLKDIKGVGRRFEEKQISDGHANNMLLPKGLAVVADNAGRARAEQVKAQSDAKHAKEDAEQQEKEQKRLEKHLKLEAFRNSSSPDKGRAGRG